MKRIKKTDAAIKKALILAHGNVAHAARSLGMDRGSVWRRMRGDEAMNQIVFDARESVADNAESALGVAVLRGEAWAVCFSLKCLGKDRGYVERGEINHNLRVTNSSAEDMTDDELKDIINGSGKSNARTKDS